MYFQARKNKDFNQYFVVAFDPIKTSTHFAPQNDRWNLSFVKDIYVVDAVTSSGILKAKQKLGVTFNFDKQDVIDLTKFSKMTTCRDSEAN